MARVRIAVGLDESEAARRALAWAVREAARWQGTMLVVTAWRPSVSGPTELLAARQRITRMQRERITEALRGVVGEVQVAYEIIIADPVTALCHVAAAAHLVVIGSDSPHASRTHRLAAAITQRLGRRLNGAAATIRVICGDQPAGDSGREAAGALITV